MQHKTYGDAGNGNGHGVLQHAHGGAAYLGHGCLLGGVGAGAHHVGLQQGALQEHLLVAQGLVLGGKHALGDLRGALDAVSAIHEHLRLHDGHQAVLLADGGVASQSLHRLLDGILCGRTGVRDLDGAPPEGWLLVHITVATAATHHLAKRAPAA